MKDDGLHYGRSNGVACIASSDPSDFRTTAGNKPAREPIARERTRGRSKALEGIRVLIVDDDPDAREVSSLVLQQAEADVRAVGSAAEALEIVNDSDGWRPDVLVSDIEMPGVDGCSLIRLIRAMEPDLGIWLPAIALTAHTRAEDRAAVLAAGFQVHVGKPVEPADLRNLVASLAKHAGRIRDH